MTILRRALIAVALMVFAVSDSSFAAGSKPRMILSPIADQAVPEGGKIKAEGVTDALRTALKDALFKTGKFVLIADSDLQKDLDSERYNQYLSGDFDPTQAAAIGRKVGAQALVKCSVVANQMSAKVKDFILYKETEFTMQLSVAVEICDIEKSVICFMHTASTEQKTKSKELSLDDGSGSQKPISLSNASDVRVKAVNEIVKELTAKIGTNAAREKGKGSVVSVKGGGRTDDAIVVDIGSSAGADVDCELAILAVDEDGFEEVIGKAKVTNAQDEKCKAVILEAKRAVAAGDVVQLKAASVASSGFQGGGNEMSAEVTAVGEGTSRDAATNDALVQAIQQAAGVYIMSEEEGRNYESVKNEVFSQTKGFIAKYDVIEEGADGGVVQIKVKALVSNKPVYNALLARKIISRQRVMVCVPEQHLKLVVPDPAGETEIIKRLIQNNFLVVDEKMSKQIREDDQAREALKGDIKGVLQLLGGAPDAEILIYGEAFSEGAQRVNTDSGPKWTCGARVEVRAVETDTGTILHADGAQATSSDATEALAGKRALKTAAELLCGGKDGVKGFVDTLLEKVLDTDHYVQCVVSGIDSESDLKTVEESLRDAIGNRPLHRYSYRDGVARINLETTRTAQDLTGVISGMQMKGKLKLVGNTVNKIELEYSRS